MARFFFLGGTKFPLAGGFMPIDAAGTIIGANAGTPVDGTSGTGAGIAGPGSLITDITNKKLYIRTNTKASPTWTLVGSQT
jgi:hypothetical protein